MHGVEGAPLTALAVEDGVGGEEAAADGAFHQAAGEGHFHPVACKQEVGDGGSRFGAIAETARREASKVLLVHQLPMQYLSRLETGDNFV